MKINIFTVKLKEKFQFIEQKTILKVQLFNAKKVSNLLAIIFGFVVHREAM
jgi:hypothetical protein